jgi:cold shock CspA family protein
MTKQIGIVKRYFIDKGFGFLRPAEVAFDGSVAIVEGAADVFFHQKELKRRGLLTLSPGAHVRFNIRQYRERPEACDIELAVA